MRAIKTERWPFGIGDPEIAEIAMSLPKDTHLHISGMGPRGRWIVRAFVEGREALPFAGRDERGYPDLGDALEYVLGMLRGDVVHGR